MPEICRFYGIVIRMYYADHTPPHFHAIYGAGQVMIGIRDLAVISGRLPPRAMGMVMEWAGIHQQELLADWNQVQDQQPPAPLAPLP